jgi:sphinganine-1-phosphate aldolase
MSARFVEAELVKIGIDLFNGNQQETCGITSTGGTESILFAIFAYRNRAIQKGIEQPELVIPETAHAAFWKACDMFCIKPIKIPDNKSTRQVDLAKVKRAITKNTIAIVGSFPNFPHGICDDIEGLSNIAVSYGIPLHVDACLGGFLTAFHKAANIQTPKYDFILPGVTSLSADLHKFGLCPKGISMLLYRNRDYRKYQYMIYPKWMGGIYPSPTFCGSRSPAFVVAAYSILIYLGKKVYVNQAKGIHDAVVKIREYGKKNFSEIEVIGEPKICVISFTGRKAMFVYDEMAKRKWALNIISNPIGFSFVITMANLENVNKTFIKDLQESYDYVISYLC